MGAARRSLGTALAPGTVLGRYELVQAVAVGGMAEIYLARSQGPQRFEKYVILKRILPHLAADDRFVEMFLEEARLAASMSHSNVVQVHDFGDAQGSFFFTMEYVHGEDARMILKTCRKRGSRLAIGDALTIVANAAAGLHYAHELVDANGQPLGVVHRDVSPSNLMVTFDGTVKVTDFGIAKATQRSNATNTGTVKGKVSYMSPEQCQGESLDRRADVFSLGIVLYELTTGSKLFGGESDLAIMRRIIEKDVPPPSSVMPDYPPALEAIVMCALQRNRDDRHPTALELHTDLERFCRNSGHGISAPTLARSMEEMFGKRQHPWIGQRLPSVITMEGNALDWDAESRPTTMVPTPTAAPVKEVARPTARRSPLPIVLLVLGCAAAIGVALVVKSRSTGEAPAAAAAPPSAPVVPAVAVDPADKPAVAEPTVPDEPVAAPPPVPAREPTVPDPPVVAEPAVPDKPVATKRPTPKPTRPAKPITRPTPTKPRDLDSPFLPK